MARLTSSMLSVMIAVGWVTWTARPQAQTRQTFAIRGHEQTLHLYGSQQGNPVIVSSGDGGWIHLGPHVAEFLSGRGFFVVGFDAKAYLAGFTSGGSTLRPDDVAADFRDLTRFAAEATTAKPVLVGVSEGAGLSVLAAADTETRAGVAGVIALGLPDVNELGWRWKDNLIYLTHQVPNEPTFSTAEMVHRIAPLPLAAIHSSHDEFVPVPVVERVLNAARDPKRLWIINASNHRFSDNLAEFDGRLLDAIAWVKTNSPR